jgi:hypothetical protein
VTHLFGLLCVAAWADASNALLPAYSPIPRAASPDTTEMLVVV